MDLLVGQSVFPIDQSSVTCDGQYRKHEIEAQRSFYDGLHDVKIRCQKEKITATTTWYFYLSYSKDISYKLTNGAVFSSFKYTYQIHEHRALTFDETFKVQGRNVLIS